MQDTDADWSIWGEGEPYYGVLSQPEYLRENLTKETLAQFWQTGINDVAGWYTLLKTHYGDFSTATGLDFGCGVGRLTHGMAAICQHVVGLDISPGMIAEAKRNPPDNAEFLLNLQDQTFDWVNSIIVFQHIPPQRGYAILEDLLSRVNPGGAISLHFTTHKDASFLPHVFGAVGSGRWDGENLAIFEATKPGEGAMMMYDYDLGRLYEIATRHGFHNILMQHTNHGGCHGAILFGRKGR